MLFSLNNNIAAETKIKTCFREGAPWPADPLKSCFVLGVY